LLVFVLVTQYPVMPILLEDAATLVAGEVSAVEAVVVAGDTGTMQQAYPTGQEPVLARLPGALL
jgi:hypothetical protein